MLLSKQCLTNNLKQWGYVSHDQNVHETLDASLQNFAKKWNRNSQRGGRVTLPLEYFGVNSGKYISDAPGPSLAVTEQWIRPPADASDPTGFITGGAARRFKIAQTAVVKVTANMNLSIKQKREFKDAFETKISELFNSVQKKNKEREHHLTEKAFNKVFEQTKFNKMR